jgi:hypothetical protein
MRITSSEEFAQCQDQWKSHFGTKLDLKYADDCLISAYCNNATLPTNEAVPPELLDCVISTSFELRALKLGGIAESQYHPFGLEVCQIGAYKVFKQLNNAVYQGFFSGLFSIHDETYVCLLTSLGLWDGVWPKYASFIAWEFYDDNLVRVIRDGIEIGRVSAPITVPMIRHDDEWLKACDS